MAVEARHLCLFPPQILSNGDMVTGNNNIYGWGAPMGYGPSPGTAAVAGGGTTLVPPAYGAATLVDSVPVEAAMRSVGGLTNSIPPVATVSRKRSRDSIGIADRNNQFLPFPQQSGSSLSAAADPFTFLGQDLSVQIHQQQFEIDLRIAQHAAKMRMEMEERRKSYSRSLITAVEETVTKKLRAKEEEIEKIGKLNSALEERVKSLCIENQLWREIAESNEATVSALRSNLDQALVAHQHQTAAAAAFQDNTQSSSSSSCCGSNDFPRNADVKELQQENGDGGKEAEKKGGGDEESGRLCRKCGKEEACLLLLPCRHLCLCAGCGDGLHTCPICLCSKNASVHINWFSS